MWMIRRRGDRQCWEYLTPARKWTRDTRNAQPFPSYGEASRVAVRLDAAPIHASRYDAEERPLDAA